MSYVVKLTISDFPDFPNPFHELGEALRYAGNVLGACGLSPHVDVRVEGPRNEVWTRADVLKWVRER